MFDGPSSPALLSSDALRPLGCMYHVTSDAAAHFENSMALSQHGEFVWNSAEYICMNDTIEAFRAKR